METSITDALIVPHHRAKLAGIAAVCILFLLMGLGTCAAAFRAGFPANVPLLLMGFIDVLFFGSASAWVLRTLRTRAPALAVDSEGVFYNLDVSSPGRIAWSQIAGVYSPAGKEGRLVCIVPRNLPAFLERQPGWKRAIMRGYMRVGLSPITIVLARVPVPFHQLIARLEAGIAPAASTANAENREHEPTPAASSS